MTNRWAIRINGDLIGSRALALSDRSASLHSSSVFRQNYQFATHRCLTASDSAATAPRPPGLASFASATSKWAIKMNRSGMKANFNSR